MNALSLASNSPRWRRHHRRGCPPAAPGDTREPWGWPPLDMPGQSSVAIALLVLVPASVALLVPVRDRGGHTTMKRVASGPRTSEKRNQYQRLRPLVWARPALTRASEVHQAPRSVVLFIGFSCGMAVHGLGGRAGFVVVEAA